MNLPVLVVIHRGQTCPLPAPFRALDGFDYPYLFVAVTPEPRQWRYRVLPPIHPSQTDETAWRAYVATHGPVLRADWTEIRGHPIGTVTVYVIGKAGGTSRALRIAQEPEPPRPGPPTKPASPTQAPPKKPVPPVEITPDMF